MRFLLQTAKAKRLRRYRDKKRRNGICLRCPGKTTDKHKVCRTCRSKLKINTRNWRTK